MLIANKNNLSEDKSPYLQQHKDNPVNWQVWSKEAFVIAKEKKIPILLSIGYSSCHWCHVMAHESFEDKETAELMNKYFLNIKVDREERPDIDYIFQSSFQLFNQSSGGWPLTMFLDENGIPFPLQNTLPVIFNMKKTNYFFASVLGFAPGFFIWNTIGSGISLFIKNSENFSFISLLLSKEIYLPILMFIIFVFITLIIKKIFFNVNSK